ncbi:PucR family transcriptional regulator [Sporomusa acidovorans]|uniref:PucR C-terminal helix-turn-helix domain-containing protein n=1 Tax=Sporomusa acidovorans (strain ATCC 49682 / DSM 3132 / Mol) TaxID=1123286 RepID=A0ABZ3J295_SPOA4|nr:helix-turn-helix domain-containing protein [Sporomusa acidovorans]OZC23182.1 purine catabolism regulatory protein [Sporomusa acidovorans DSM 3132]SDE96871.1 PucR C-terminal helix-turn-helix domain-containing protein [Sporomusa acidovorans]
MPANIRRIACELNNFRPQLFINSRKNEDVAAAISVSKLPSKYRNDVLYIIKASMLTSLPSSMPINILCICDVEVSDKLFSDSIHNFILFSHPLDVKIIREEVQNIIRTCSGEGYIPQKLLDAVSSGGLQNIADTAYLLLGNPIIIYDLSFKILAFSQNVYPECKLFKKAAKDKQMIEQTMIAFFQENALKTMREQGSSYFFECCDRPVLPEKTIIINSPVFIKGLLVGYAVAMKGYVNWDKGDLGLMDEICKTISIEMRNDRFYRNSKGVLKEHFLMDTLEAETEQKELVKARVNALDMKMHKNMFIVVIRLTEQMEDNSQLRLILREIENIFEDSISIIYKENIVSLIHFHQDKQVLMEIIQEKFHICNSSEDLVTGVSMCFHDICQIKKHYFQALDALDIGLTLQKPGRIYFFQQLSIYRLFKLSGKTTEIRDYLHPAVFCLINYDNENHSELMKTLYYYIINLKALLKTKDILRIHRNTLIYRINKIQELANIDLEDGETVFQLYITFKGLEYIACQENREVDFW